jgi:predicted nucleic acid-binding protein
MIVVSDTSPLNYLVLIDAIDLLPRLFGEVYVPPAVIEELAHSRTPDVVKEWIQSSPAWLRIQPPAADHRFTDGLGPGETAAIALAIELGASAVLIDEKAGRRIAKAQGLATLGTITVLELGAEQQLIDLNAAIVALSQTTFHITDELLDAALARDAARKRG